MVVLDVRLDNLYAFKNFHLNFAYPKKIVGSCIKDEHLANRPNFRYKKVNIIMGANASGKTSFGRALMNIFNFIDKKNYKEITGAINNREKNASFVLDTASNNVLYRVACVIAPSTGGEYSADDVHLEIRQETIRTNDSYESCIKRLEAAQNSPSRNYIEELEKMEELYWLFEYPEDTARILRFPKNDRKFEAVLERIVKTLDPAIQKVEKSHEVENAYVIRFQNNRSIILQDGDRFTTNLLSSGTKAGVEVAAVVSALIQGSNYFYYCDEKFPYTHSDIEKAVLSLMIDSIKPNQQLFFTTHNTDILDMNLPKHSFTFFRKDTYNEECPITCVDASSLLKRSTDSLKNAVENDLFSSAPEVELIYDIANL